jgi:hypothetical protein
MKFLTTYSYIAFATYTVCAIIYSTIWVFIMQKVVLLSKGQVVKSFSTMYGDFLGVFIDDNIWSIIFSSVVIIAILLCFI